MKSIHLIVDSKERVHSAENEKEQAESNARYLSISHASRPYRVVSLHFDGPLGFWSGHHLCEAAGIDLRGLRWELDTLRSAARSIARDDETAQRTIEHVQNHIGEVALTSAVVSASRPRIEIDPDALIDSPDEVIANLREMREFLIRQLAAVSPGEKGKEP